MLFFFFIVIVLYRFFLEIIIIKLCEDELVDKLLECFLEGVIKVENKNGMLYVYVIKK